MIQKFYIRRKNLVGVPPCTTSIFVFFIFHFYMEYNMDNYLFHGVDVSHQTVSIKSSIDAHTQFPRKSVS